MRPPPKPNSCLTWADEISGKHSLPLLALQPARPARRDPPTPRSHQPRRHAARPRQPARVRHLPAPPARRSQPAQPPARRGKQQAPPPARPRPRRPARQPAARPAGRRRRPGRPLSGNDPAPLTTPASQPGTATVSNTVPDTNTQVTALVNAQAQDNRHRRRCYLRHRRPRRRTRSPHPPSPAAGQNLAQGSCGRTNRELIADRDTRIAARLRAVEHEYHAAIERDAVLLQPESTGALRASGLIGNREIELE